MSAPRPNTTLSLSARLLCYIGPPSTILLTSLASPRTALVSPIAFLPAAWLLRKWRKSNDTDPSRRGKLEPMLWIFTAAGTLGITAGALIQMAICVAVSRPLFGSGQRRKDFWTEFPRSTVSGLSAEQLATRAELASSWETWVFNGVLSFVAAALVEETIKYLPIVYARWGGTDEERRRRDRAYVDYVLAGALGYSISEHLAFLFAACERNHESALKLTLTIAERSIGSVGHLLVATLSALRAVRRDYYGDKMSWWSVVGPAVLLHGANDFVAFSASAMEGNVGWIHPTGAKVTTGMLTLAGGLIATAGWLVRREWKILKARDQKEK